MTNFNAVEFLHSLFDSPEQIDISPEDLPHDWFERWEERAAIMEYDGKLPQERAEAEALKDILAVMKREGFPVDSILSFRRSIE